MATSAPAKSAPAKNAVRARPLSPHLSVWRWHWTMASSILHRATGSANAIGSLLIVGWLLALALGPEAYAAYQSFFGWWPVQVVLFGFTVAIMYHLANGIRHLVWDSGHGFNPKLSDATGLFCITFGLFGAIAVWVFAGLVPGITVSQFGG